MIGRVLARGSNLAGLLYYLYGKGKACEHVSPHLVAGWRHPAGLEPPARPGGGRDFRYLTGLLTQPLALLGDGARGKPVWHCAVRAAPGDPDLGDGAWMAIAEEIMHRTGLSRRDEDGKGVRWVAVHHGANHIHIVAVLARQDGRRAALHNDYYRIGEALRDLEAEYGLVAVARPDRTAGRRPGRAEQEKAGRNQRAEAPRVTLQRHAATAAAAAGSEAEFFTLLEQAGVRVRLRRSSRDPGQVTGYAVALDDDKNPDGEPVWYGGGKLAADLSLPKLRARWDPARTGAVPGPGPGGPDAAWDEAAAAAAAASGQLGPGPPGPDAADIAWAAADVLRAAAAVLGSPALRLAADAYDRAARASWGRLPPPSPAGIQLRAAARLVAAAAHVSRDRPLAHIAFLIRLAALLEAVAELRQAQQRLVQATAAAAAARQLRAAAAGPPGPPGPAGPAPARGPAAVRLAAADFPAGPATRTPPRQAPGPARPPRPPRPGRRRPRGPSP